MAALLAILAAASWGSSDFLAGNASRRSSAVSVVILTHFAAVVTLLLVAVDVGPLWSSLTALASGGEPGWAPPRMVGSPTVADLGWGLAAGLGGGFGAMLLFRGLGKGAMAVVAPVTAAGAAIIPVVVGLASGDPITVLSILGIGLALVAIVLVSLAAPDTSPATTSDRGPATETDTDRDPGSDARGGTGDGSGPMHDSLTVPPGWVEEFRLSEAPAGGLPAPDAGMRVAILPPPTVVPSAPFAASSGAPTARVDRSAATEGLLQRHVRGLLQVIIALLVALVAAAGWIAGVSLAHLDRDLGATHLGALGVAIMLVAVAAGTLWVSAPVLRTSSPRVTTGSTSPGADRTPGPRRLLALPGLPEALLSGIGFGLFFVFIYRTSESAGQWPLIGARTVSVVMFAIAALFSSTSILPAAGSRMPVAWAGLFDAIAAILFVVATRSGSLSVAAVLASLYPAVTVLFAWAITKERIRAIQLVGLAVALGAAAILAL